MDYFLQKVCGKPAWQAVTLRRCTPAEAPAVFALQNEVRAAMPHPEQFVPDTLKNISRCADIRANPKLKNPNNNNFNSFYIKLLRFAKVS